MRRAGTHLLLPFMGLALLACQDKPGKTEIQSCFLELTRKSPGRLVLAEPVACSKEVARYRLAGSSKERPEKIDYLAKDGSNRLSYRVRYDDQGRPVSEERLYVLEPATYKLYGGRTQLEFSQRAPGKWDVTRIVTDLDAQGRPLKTRKYVGAELQYSVVSEYRGGWLHSRATYDGKQRLKNRIEYIQKDGRRFERMHGADGKVLMEREVEGKDPEAEQALDTSGRRPVHSPLPSN